MNSVQMGETLKLVGDLYPVDCYRSVLAYPSLSVDSS